MTDSELRALHEEATCAPWGTTDCSAGGLILTRGSDSCRHPQAFLQVVPASDAALIVALRNAYARGELVHRDEVGAVQDVLPLLIAEHEANQRAADAFAYEGGNSSAFRAAKKQVGEAHELVKPRLAAYRRAVRTSSTTGGEDS